MVDAAGRGINHPVRQVVLRATPLALVALALAGCGGSGSGDAGSGEAGRTATIAEAARAREVREAELTAKPNPRDAEALARLIRARYLAAATDGNVSRDGFSAAGTAQLRKAAADWERYLALKPRRPDVQLASVMVQVVNVNALNQPRRAALAQELVVEQRRPPNASLFAQLALLYYQAGQRAAGDKAAGRAVQLSPPGQRAPLRRQLRQLRASQESQAP